jgi:hypothetical protein
MHNKSIDFTGMNIYIGLDVHKKSWSVTILSDEVEHKTFNTSPGAENLSKYLREHFPGGNYHSAYEAGFCGFDLENPVILTHLFRSKLTMPFRSMLTPPFRSMLTRQK